MLEETRVQKSVTDQVCINLSMDGSKSDWKLRRDGTR